MKKMPVILTFDIDGETLWRCRDPKNAERPVILSQGQYGPETAMPRILKLLRRHSVHATFFIPGFTAEEYPDMVRQIAAQGHDIGNHSWSHTYPDNMDGREQEEREYHDCSDILEKLTGRRPKGYRSPAWEFSPYSIDILEKMGDIEYSSNMMNTEEIRYLTVNGRKVDIPSYQVKAGDVIEVAESSRSSEIFKRLLGQDAPVFLIPAWMEREKNALKGTVTRLPAREDIDVPVEEHLIVELYSK